MESIKATKLFAAIMKHEEIIDQGVVNAIVYSFSQLGQESRKLDWSSNVWVACTEVKVA